MLQVYASSREEEMAVLAWSQAEIDSFVRMQFEAQRADYERRFPLSSQSVILVDGVAVGRIWINRTAEEIRLLDIALLPAQRNRGLGGELVRELIEQARSAQLPLRHSVYKTNEGALRFYRRLGFGVVEDFGTYVLMEWGPED